MSTAPGDLRYGFEEASDAEAEEDLVTAAAPVSEDLPVQPYFVTISRRTGFRRFHVVGKCHVHAERCQQAEMVESLDRTSFDAICRVAKSTCVNRSTRMGAPVAQVMAPPRPLQ